MTPNQTKPFIENLKRNNILIVEDHPSLADILRRIITAYGARVSYVDSGNKALTQVKRKPPDLILLDLSLPDMDGLEVATRLRQNENTKSVPILLMSASPNKKRMFTERVQRLHSQTIRYHRVVGPNFKVYAIEFATGPRRASKLSPRKCSTTGLRFRRSPHPSLF